VSESSRAAARSRLARFGERIEFLPLNMLPAMEAGLVFSNELLDAFPVNRVTQREGELNEIYVAVDEAGAFKWALGPLSTLRISEYLNSLATKINEGQIAEINLGIEDWLKNVAARLVNGYVVTVDYGAEASELFGLGGREQGTLRAFRRHQFVDDVLTDPGKQDLTTTIDWSFVQKLGWELGMETVEFERQDRFLLKAGLLEELETLTAESEKEADRIETRAACREMILPNGMAASFQVLVQKKLRQL